MDFYDLDLNDYVLDALDDMNFTDTTPIQEHAIPPILEGRDVMGVAQTGTGKTAAYLLPVLSLLEDGGFPKDAINCVIMSPTRELAQQIDQAMQGFSYYLSDISSVAVYGGNDGIRYEQEKRSMQNGADVIIATPGRLISHLQLGNIDLSRVSFFILDEADRMLDMGFYEDIIQIAKALPKERQTIMFSATMPQNIMQLAKTLLVDPVEVKLAVSKPAEAIHQSAYICYEAQKLGIIKSIFKAQAPQRVIIFTGSKLKTRDLAISISRAGYNARAMHSDLEQSERDKVMYEFRSGQTDILVATDIVARGIDIDDIQLVINFDVPHDEEDYVHRIGRTARAGRGGRAITLVGEKDQPQFKQIERFLEKEVEKEAIPEELGEGPAYTGRASRGADGGKKGKRGRGKGQDKQHGRQRGNGKKQGPKDNRNDKPASNTANGTTSEQQPASNTANTQAQTGEPKRKKTHRGGRNKKKPNAAPAAEGQQAMQQSAPTPKAEGQQPKQQSAPAPTAEGQQPKAKPTSAPSAEAAPSQPKRKPRKAPSKVKVVPAPTQQ